MRLAIAATDDAVATSGLGFVKRDISHAGQFVGVGLTALGGRDADGDTDEGLAAEDVEGLIDRFGDAACKLERPVEAGRMDVDDPELVAAKASERVVGADQLA